MPSGKWQLFDGTTYYEVVHLEEVKRQLKGLNYAKFDLAKDTNLNEDITVDLLNPDDQVVLKGFIKKGTRSSEYFDVYEMTEFAVELNDYLVEDPADTFKQTYTGQTVNYIVDKILLGTSWSRVSSDTSTVSEISFYHTPKLDGLFKLLEDTKGWNVWFHKTARQVYFGTVRTDRTGTPLSYVSKETERSSFGRKVNKVIVVGSSEDIWGYGWDATPNPKTVAFQYDTVKSVLEADLVAMDLLSKLGTVSKSLEVVLTPTIDIDEGDKVRVDGEDYTVKEVVIKYESTKVVLNELRKTSAAMVDDKFKQVTLDVSGAGLGKLVGSGCTGSVIQPTVECSPSGFPCEIHVTAGLSGKVIFRRST